MKLELAKTDLVNATAIVGRAVSSRPSLQVLAGIRLAAHDQRLELAATDMELSLAAEVEANISEHGEAVVPGRIFVDVVRNLPADRVTVESSSDSSLSLRSGNAHFTLRCLPAADFPAFVDDLPTDKLVELPFASLSDAIARVARAASRDETRPHLTGVLLQSSSSHLRLVATDSYRLAVIEVPVAIEGIDANIPARSLQELARIGGQLEQAKLQLAVDEQRAIFVIDHVRMVSRLVEGRFPSYEQLLPDAWEHELALDRDELLDVVRRVALLAQRHSPLKLCFREGELEISAATPDVGEASEKLPVSYSGDEFEIGFNPDFLRDGLETALSQNIRLKLLTPLRPALIESASQDGNQRMLYLVMPIRLNT